MKVEHIPLKEHPTTTCLVLDPFCGSGTTGAVARRLGRGFIGVDLNPEYLDMARKRVFAIPLSLGLDV